MLMDTVIESLVAPANQAETARSQHEVGEFLCHSLVEAPTFWSESNHRPTGASVVEPGFNRGEDRPGSEHHAGAAAEGRIVDRLMDTNGMTSEIVSNNVDVPVLRRPSEDARTGVRFDQLRKEREDAHPWRSPGAVVIASRAGVHRDLRRHRDVLAWRHPEIMA